jgi:hypothetical protein
VRERSERAVIASRRWRPLGSAISVLSALSACGPAAVDHTPTGNVLDADTQSLEGGIGHWQAWYSTKIARSTGGAQQGLASLGIDVTAADGWGVQFDNWPGFTAAAGAHRIELWARTVAGSALELRVSVHWRNDSGDDLRSDELRMPLDRAWRKLGQDAMAPRGTARTWIELTGDGAPGDTLELDEIFIL